MGKTVKLSIGFSHEGKEIKELELADTGAEAEKVYSERPKQTALQEWFASIVAVSIKEIGGVAVAEEYIQTKKVPDVVYKIPFLDVGGLIVQIQRECWEETIENQRFRCTNCGTVLETDIDLQKIKIPAPKEGEAVKEFRVKLPETITIDTAESGTEALAEFDGKKFNQLVFRTITLGDAKKHQEIMKDEVRFWQELSYDTLKDLEYVGEDGEILDVVGSTYVNRRSKALFKRDFSSKSLRTIRKEIQTAQPSAKYYYEDTCYDCGKETPFFASVSSFFMV